MYIHQKTDWPEFHWDVSQVNALLASVRFEQGLLLGRMASLGLTLRQDAVLQVLTQDALKTSEIEGEILDPTQVRSSFARQLGLKFAGMKPSSKDVDGIVTLLLDATTQFQLPLSKERLFEWHQHLFPQAGGVFYRVNVGVWRNKASGPMQVISGPMGREKVHFEAPEAKRLPVEMKNFIRWFNRSDGMDLVLKSAIAHFWFVTIHPFDDGNGRIARALADLLLARSENSTQRFYSMSTQIQRDRKAYYAVLEAAQKGGLDITAWICWYLQSLKEAIQSSIVLLEQIIVKAEFWKKYEAEALNDRQRKVLNRLLDGFNGHLTTTKWAKLTHCSQDTALRDITDLTSRLILKKAEGGGRSTHYVLNALLSPDKF